MTQTNMTPGDTMRHDLSPGYTQDIAAIRHAYQTEQTQCVSASERLAQFFSDIGVTYRVTREPDHWRLKLKGDGRRAFHIRVPYRFESPPTLRGFMRALLLRGRLDHAENFFSDQEIRRIVEMTDAEIEVEILTT